MYRTPVNYQESNSESDENEVDTAAAAAVETRRNRRRRHRHHYHFDFPHHPDFPDFPDYDHHHHHHPHPHHWDEWERMHEMRMMHHHHRMMHSDSESEDEDVDEAQCIANINVIYYNLDFKYTGLAIFITNYTFKNGQNNFGPQCYSVENDIDHFKVLEQFKFQTKVHVNETRAKTLDLIEHYTSAFDFSDYACLLICASSHGDPTRSAFLSVDERLIDINDQIMEPFERVESLRGKPKIFLFDCYRAGYSSRRDEYDDELGEEEEGERERRDDDETRTSYYEDVAFNQRLTHPKWPNVAEDYFLGFAVVKNAPTHLLKFSLEKSSHFISTFFEILYKNGRQKNWSELTSMVREKMLKKKCHHRPEFSHLAQSNKVFAFAKLDNSLNKLRIGTSPIEGRLVNKYELKLSVCCMAALHDGTLACAIQDGTIELWRVINTYATRLKVLIGHTSNYINAMKVLTDDMMVSTADDGLINIWNTTSGQLLVSYYHRHRDRALSLEKVSDTLFATGSWDKSIQLYNFRNEGSFVKRLEFDDIVYAMEFVRDQNFLVVLIRGKVVILSMDNNYEKMREIVGEEFRCMAMLADGRSLAIGSDQKNVITIWNVLRGTLLRTLTGHTEGVLRLLVLSDGSLASGGRDREIRIWNAKYDGQVGLLKTMFHGRWISMLVQLVDGSLVSAFNESNEVKIWK